MTAAAPRRPAAEAAAGALEGFWVDVVIDGPGARIRNGEVADADKTAEVLRHCKACDVKWTGGPACWCCGKTVTP